MVGLEPYPNYKDSGVPWLGPVPAHWDVLPNRALVAEVREREHPEEPMLSVTIASGVVLQAALLAGSSKKDSSRLDRSSYKLVRPGDIAYNKMRAWQGAIGASVHRGIVSPAYVVQRPREGVLARYLHYLFRTPAFAKEAERWSYGITSDMWSLRPEHFKMIYSCLPHPSEQAAIVRFLDHVDRRIRRYIAAQKRLIALLNEQKRAIIHRAVTRGLDPSVRLKPSGVDWLGDVPEHWEVLALRHRYCTQLGKMLDAKRITGQSLVPYLRNVDVQWDSINIYDLPAMDIAPHEHSRYTLSSGDLLVCEGGEVGRCAFWHGELGLCGYQKALHRVRPRNAERDAPRFLFYAMYVAAKLGVFAAQGSESTIAHLTGVKLRRHRFPFPPACEQRSVASRLDTTVECVEGAVTKAGMAIDLLREYRTRLIADVITGKLDVREAAAGLPDEPEELVEAAPDEDVDEQPEDPTEAEPAEEGDG